MSNIKLVHSGGNSVSLTTPTSNPSSNVTFKLPQSDGTAGQVLQTDGNGNLSWVTLGVTMVDHWRVTANSTAGAEAVLTDWAQVSTANQQPGRIGSSMSVSSGVFTFPSTGIYNIIGSFAYYFGSANDAIGQVWLKVTNDNSNYNIVTSWRAGSHEDNIHHTVTQNYILDVTSTSNVKFYFETDSFSGNTSLRGDANIGESNVTIIRLGDT